MSHSQGYDTTDKGKGHSQPSSSPSPQEHKEEQNRFVQLAHLGALGATAIAKYEADQVKADPERAEKHRKQEKLASSVAVGLAGYAMQDNQKPGQPHGAESTSTSTSTENHFDTFEEGKKLLQSFFKKKSDSNSVFS